MSSRPVVLERNLLIGVATALLGLAAVAWYLTVRQAADMAGMVTGLGQIGVRMPNEMSGPLFLGMWVVMMVAMMFPTVVPIVSTHLAVSRRKGRGFVPTAVFVLGYLTVWTAIGLVPMAAFLAFERLTTGAPWLPWLAGAVLIGAGVYQFTPLKTACLRACQNPLSFVLTHDWGGGAIAAYRAGAAHGIYCLGCCWALMAVLLVVGFMNLAWMALLALVFLAEKTWRQGPALSRVAGTAVAIVGVVVILQPALLRAIA
jgi:predicted metal-binding membrane protein